MTGRHWFWVDGDPIPQGSKRAPVAGVVRESSKGLHAWRRKVALIARSNRWLGSPHDGPVAVGIVFARRRPRSHYHASGSLRSTAPRLPTSKPDVDKLERAILDALTGVCWVDDSRVVLVHKMKIYGDAPGAWILVHPITAIDPEIAGGYSNPAEVARLLANALVWLTNPLERPSQNLGTMPR